LSWKIGEFELDPTTYELRRRGIAQPVEPQVFDLLVLLVTNADRIVTKDELLERIWGGRIVSEATINSRIAAARQAIDDDGKAQSLIKTIQRRGFRFVGTVQTLDRGDVSHTLPPTIAGSRLEQDIRYCRAKDGVRIAYARTGNGSPIVKAANWMSHLEFDLESPIWRHWIEALSKNHLLIRYDERGNGLSDREVTDLSFEAMVADLEAVVDAQGLDRFALFGISQGCAVSVEYALRHPGRVTHLILYGGFAKGWRKQGDAAEIDRRIAMSSLIRAGWGQDNSAFRQLFTSRFIPGASPDQMAWFNELQRKTVSPAIAGDLHDVFGTIDVSARLSQVNTPTLVLHARNDAEIPMEAGRAFATSIAGARFVSLESENHILLEREPAFARLIQEIHRFVAS
jgi:pimeloyl-ACP methyl ester carboxylesterase/DNA-binding winged helix-turn-helix (wHTH) protein